MTTSIQPVARVSLLDRFTDRTTRQGATEVAAICYLLLYPELLLSWKALRVSPPASAVLEILREMPSASRAGILPIVRIALESPDADSIDSELRTAIWELASDVASVTVEELAAVGTSRMIFDSLSTELRRAAQRWAA